MTHTINASANPTAGGTISITTPTGLTLPATVDEGTSLTLSASANENYQFVKWTTTDSDEALSTEISYTVPNISSDLNLVAHFKSTATVQTYAITLGDHSHGSLSVSPETAAEGETVTVTADPDDGYKLTSITITKTEGGAQYKKISDGTMTFTMPAYGVTVKVNYGRITYTITYDLDGGSLAGDATNPSTYDINTTTFTLNNPTKGGFTFAGWTGTGLSEPTEIVTITKGSTGNRSYTAIWTEDTPAPTTISDVTISGLTAPVKGAALQSSTSGITTTDGTTVQSISWKKDEETVKSGAVAEANTAYTVVLTLSANDNYEFASGVAATVNDQNATSVALADRTLTVTYQFAATDEDAPTAFGITNANTGNISVAGSATEGSDVTITVTVPNGKKIKAVKVYKTGEENTKETVTADTDDATKFTFKMPAYEVTVAVEFEDVYSIVGQEVVSAEDATNWTFTSADEINAIKHLGEGLYGRGRDKSKSTNQQINFSPYSGKDLKFNDGTSVTPSYYATTTGVLSGANKIHVSAGYDSGTLFTPSFAFNTRVAGTTYVKIKKPTTAATKYRFCIYFNNGTTITTGYEADASDNEINEISYHNTEAGTVFIGSTGDKCEIYAIRYVPDTYEYAITLPDETDEGSITGAAKAKAGDKVTLTVTPKGTYELEALSVKDANDNEISVAADHSFTMPASLVTVTATFRAQTPKVELTITQPEEGGSIQIDGEAVSSKSVSKGDALTLTAVPASGYWLKQWLVGGVAQESKDFVLTITMDNAKEVTAEFEKLEVATGSVISFKGLKEEDVTLSNSASFEKSSSNYPQYTYKNGETGVLKINNMMFSYAKGTPNFMLHSDNLRGSAKDGRIEIPNLKKDQIIVAEFSSNSSGDVSFALSNGTFITETTSVTGTTATKLKMKTAENGSLIITNSTNGYRLYSIALANTLTTEVTKTDSNEEMGSITVTPANTTDDQGESLYLTGSKLTLTANMVKNCWADYYTTIASANTLIDKMEDVNFTDEDVKNQYRAEARFIRALAYFDLVRFFGNIPAAVHALTTEEAFSLGQSSEREIYEQIIVPDLEYAVKHLAETAVDFLGATHSERVSNIAARGLLGKVYLTMAGFPLYQTDKKVLAQQLLKEVIDYAAETGKFWAEDINEWNHMWIHENDNKYFIFEIQYIAEKGEGNPMVSLSVPSNPGTEWCARSLVTGTHVYIENGLQQHFIQRSSDTDEYIDLRIGGTMNTRTSKGEDNEDFTPTGSTFYVKFFENKLKRAELGYSDMDATIVDRSYWPQNYPILRLEDVMLLYAECVGPTVEGYEMVNSIRRRAGLEELSDLSEQEFQIAVDNERRYELAEEGHRWFDLARHNQYVETMRQMFINDDKTVNGTYKAFASRVTKDMYLYPIPQSQLEVRKGLYTQNAGY